MEDGLVRSFLDEVWDVEGIDGGGCSARHRLRPQPRDPPFFFSPFQVRLINNNIWLGRVYTTDILRYQKFTGAGKGRKNLALAHTPSLRPPTGTTA